MATWLTLPENVPTDGQTVYVRIDYYSSKPFLAIFTLSTMTFISVDNTITYPAWVIARWKPM